MTAEMIGLLLLGACYASFYACGSSSHLYYYLTMLAITVISLTRGPIMSMLSCLPLTLAPLAINKRIMFCAAMIICTMILFNTERVQQRMFYSGSGEVADLRLNNPQLRTSGRSAMWDILWIGVEREPWLGNGWNSHRVTLLKSGTTLYLPHNDWLKLLYDMGIVGVGIYLITMILQMFSLARIARWSSGAQQMLAYSVATAFIPYALIMLTDNVILYVNFFGNLHFALIGIIYGALRRNDL
jgi:O-antigen ligase